MRALILSGGGARGAYHAGVLRGVAKILNTLRANKKVAPLIATPFDVLCGVSAGAINVAALAALADNFDFSTKFLRSIWLSLNRLDIYRSDRRVLACFTPKKLRHLLGLRTHPVASLLSNQPLSRFLKRKIDFMRLAHNVEKGVIRGLSVGTFCYSNLRPVVFYDTPQPHVWEPGHYLGVRTPISVSHLMASSAIPVLFPAQRVEVEQGHAYFGDGSVRELAPLEAAIQLGATQFFVVSCSTPSETDWSVLTHEVIRPSLASIASSMIASTFSDALSVEVDHLGMLNKVLDRQQQAVFSSRVMKILPSSPLIQCAVDHIGELPRLVSLLLKAFTGNNAELAAYLLFGGRFAKRLLSLGEHDIMNRREELISFLLDQ